jgi:hypothetical protein
VGFILKRTDQGGGYVAPAGSKRSYTRSPHRARIFETLEEAQDNRCPGNEVVMQFFPASGPVRIEEGGDNAAR